MELLAEMEQQTKKSLGLMPNRRNSTELLAPRLQTGVEKATRAASAM